jgi:hypothetical protein
LNVKFSDDVLADIHRVARAKLDLPTTKSIAARAQCSERNIAYHISRTMAALRRIANYEKKRDNSEKRGPR